MSALTSLTLAFPRWMEPALPDCHFPSLRFIKLFDISDPVLLLLLPFLERHGTLITGLHIRSQFYFNVLPSILSRTTSLQSIVLDQNGLGHLSMIPGSDLSLPSMSYVGIQLKYHPGSGDTYTVPLITSWMGQLLTNRVFPGLREVRLLDLESHEPLETECQDLSTLCRSHNVVLSGKE